MNEPLEAEATPPPGLKRRVIRSLRGQGVLRTSRGAWSSAARVAAAIALFAGGVLLGRVSAARAPDPEGGQYLLALHEDARFTPSRPLPELVQEYGGWAGEMEGQGRLVAAEQLGWSSVLPEQPGIEPGRPPGGPLGEISGVFLIRASDREDALAVARTHPHLRYGGTIEVREVIR